MLPGSRKGITSRSRKCWRSWKERQRRARDGGRSEPRRCHRRRADAAAGVGSALCGTAAAGNARHDRDRRHALSAGRVRSDGRQPQAVESTPHMERPRSGSTCTSGTGPRPISCGDSMPNTTASSSSSSTAWPIARKWLPTWPIFPRSIAAAYCSCPWARSPRNWPPRPQWLEPYCLEHGLTFCPRRHIEWFGCRRGT